MKKNTGILSSTRGDGGLPAIGQSFVGYMARTRAYLSDTYPIPAGLVRAAIIFLGQSTVLANIHDTRVNLVSKYSLIGIWSVFSLLLILRLMDELKDREIDRQLFSDRPLPSGRVRESDLVFSLVVLIVLFVLVNSQAGNAFWAALAVLGYALLMFVYFFMPGLLRQHLLLNLATHNPVIPLMLLYLAILFSVESGMEIHHIDWAKTLLSIAMIWAPFFAWEIARKIRSAEEETAYVTYSQIFGRAGAVLVAGLAQALALGLGIYFYRIDLMSAAFTTILIGAFSIVVVGYVRFLWHPSPRTSRLQPFAEFFALATLVAVILDYVIAGSILTN